MSARLMCPHCGFLNSPDSAFCEKCRTALTSAPTTQNPNIMPYSGPLPKYEQESFYGRATTMAQLARGRDMDKTKTGLLLLIIGILLGPIPYANYLGGLLVLIGAIVVITGRNSFGPAHSRNTVFSAVIYAAGSLVLILIVLASTSSAIYAVQAGASAAQALSSAITNALVSAVVGGIILGLAQVLFTYAIQDRLGKTLLWLGYAASIAVSILIVLIVSPEISVATAQSTANGFDPAPFYDLQTRLRALMLVDFIPAIINASALYLARSRIERGEIPALVSPRPLPF